MIKKSVVYRHPDKGSMVIKDGFSWPGFFFVFIWLFYKRLWLQGIILLVIFFPGNLLAMFAVGFDGNYWIENQLKKKGYIQIEGQVKYHIKIQDYKEHFKTSTIWFLAFSALVAVMTIFSVLIGSN